MTTIKKTIKVAIDVNTISHPDEDPCPVVMPSQFAGAVSPGHTRFIATIEIDCPIADYEEVAPEQITVEKETGDKGPTE